MEHEYKSHCILITTWPSLNPAGFTPDIRINNKSTIVYERLKVSQLFSTKEEAETQAYELAKEWIDSRMKTNGSG